MQFYIVGDRDPFLLGRLNAGETFYAESGAMVSMDSTLDLDGRIRGGILGGLARKLVAGETLFTQQVHAARGPGEILLAPALPGDIQLLDVSSSTTYLLADGAFLAADEGVDLKIRIQSLGNAIFGGTGGFFVVEATGRGQLAVAGFGSVLSQSVTPASELVVDNQHVVAWDSRLDYSVKVGATQSRGLMGRMVGAVTSGEGLVTHFRGTGKVYLSSRNIHALRAAIGQPGGAGASPTHQNLQSALDTVNGQQSASGLLSAFSRNA